jgi:type I restriction enzyme S subunit
MSFPGYPEHKPTEIEWLPTLPTHWTLSKFARHFAVRMGETIPEGELSEDGWLPVFSATEKDKYYGFVSKRAPLAGAGDLVIPARGNSIGHVKLVREAATATQTTIVANNIDPGTVFGKYAYYWSIGLREILFHFDRTAIPQITTEYVSRNRFAFPGLPEQTQIAQFLDHETAKIDTLIHEQKRLIELLKEKRQAVISHAVTKGLDPDVPMKDSGVEWLGEVPAHWGTPKLSWRSNRIGDGLHSTPVYEDNTGYYFVNGNNLVDGSINLSSSAKEVSYEEFVKHQVELGPSSVFISINGTIGNVAIYEGEPIILGKSAAYINCDLELHRKFLLHYLKSGKVGRYFDLEMTGTTISNLSLRSLRHLKVSLPPMVEQEEIVKYLDAECLRYDNEITVTESLKRLLIERRSALISAAVTGKIDVRNWQPPADESAFEDVAREGQEAAV